MPFEDFHAKTWRVIPPGSEECKAGETVRISGPANEVTIECGGRAPYAEARYNEGTNRIETDDARAHRQSAAHTAVPRGCRGQEPLATARRGGHAILRHLR